MLDVAMTIQLEGVNSTARTTFVETTIQCATIRETASHFVAGNVIHALRFEREMNIKI